MRLACIGRKPLEVYAQGSGDIKLQAHLRNIERIVDLTTLPYAMYYLWNRSFKLLLFFRVVLLDFREIGGVIMGNGGTHLYTSSSSQHFRGDISTLILTRGMGASYLLELLGQDPKICSDEGNVETVSVSQHHWQAAG
ncbi:hypothetical protein IFM89_001488 [Coptis chinensis]|uniref:Uncharacterized protein n=1 Tax=Coptis chinensis TaxID=261450 RepID=A0A835LI34_9MAGN|nr:hypothetical protein IFM89_001488 [Coptis chinensis]